MGLFKRKATEDEDVVTCPECGERLPEGTLTCAMCGHTLEEVEAHADRD